MSKRGQTVFSGDGGAASGEESAGEMIWPPPSFDKSQKGPLVPHGKKKRYHSASFSHSGTNGLTIDGIPSDLHKLTAALHKVQLSGSRLPYGKNSKKSRDGRKLPSKRGGKHDDPTDVLDEIELDPEDPDFDSDVDAPVTFDEFQPTLADDIFEKTFISLMNEFFIHGKTQEVIDVLSDMSLAGHQRRRLPYLAITLAIQHRQTQCELTSELLSDMCGKVLNHAHIQQGFQLVFSEIGDLIIDVPKVPEYIGRFIARAVTDDILPPKFIELQRNILSQVSPSSSPLQTETGESENAITVSTKSNHSNSQNTIRVGTRNFSDSSSGGSVSVDTSASSGIGSASSLITVNMSRPDLALEALNRAESILTLRHAYARLDNIWGVPAGPKATKMLVKKIKRLVKSFIESNDIDEATAALLELDAPHFRHELVFQSIIMAIEISTEDARERVIRLLKELCASVVLTIDQLTLGVKRVYAELPDLQIDVPAAYTLMELFMNGAIKAGFIPRKLANEFTTKPRKRFISETDSIYRTNSSKPW
ncbi:Programmed cell death protein 4 [Schistosoma haematobium]|uniref:Programmed cell death protein 4 n=1 Tax=Schistosoma haematobium TaxID=6185 RepID=A0A094ZUS1_SCHHA|nr:Programmed cell death protein 4 [Schistosoma haematobium]KAH9584752.1 Programmed cell death protein 4 [Schistosoma haematobium]CAH8505947.1 unnamed protein product [Schistosoma haematobium]CAH8508365.1 unnamed protein product [Schistosoma haematobium]